MYRITSIVLLSSALLADASGPVRYAYDDAGRLVRVDYPSGASIAYTYDAAGNLLSRVRNAAEQSNPPVSTKHPQRQSRAKHIRANK